MTRRTVALARGVAGGAVLVVLVWRLGAGPFVRGLRAIDAGSVLAALAIPAAATGCAAWRWRRVARALGAPLTMPQAVAAYYRSQLVNLTVPGGVLGDVDRAVGHGHRTGDLGVAARAVVWERAGGQAVQALMTLVVLAVIPSPVRSALRAGLLVAAGALALGALVLAVRMTRRRREGSQVPAGGPLRRALRATRRDARVALLGRHTWLGVAVASLLAITGHGAIMLMAAHLAAPAEPVVPLLPLAVLVLAASAVPLHLLGWGPREAIAAWVFAAAGLGADVGVETATVYGILALTSCLPGAVVMVADWYRHGRLAGVRTRATSSAPAEPLPVAASHPPVWQGGGHG